MRIPFAPIALPASLALAACSMSEPPPPTAASVEQGALLTWDQFLARPLPRPDRTIRYGDHERQVVDVFLPQGPGPHPVVVMVHGGCWSPPWDRTLMNHASDDLRRRGIAVWNIDYRVIENGSGYPHVFADSWAAMARLASDGPNLGLDPQRVVAVGHSAGGHLALWYAAKRRGWAPPPTVRMIPPTSFRSVISLGGLPDLELAARPPGSGCGTQVVEQLIGRGQPRWRPSLYHDLRQPSPDPFADTSVPRMGGTGVPQVLINGTEDRIIPTHFAEDYAGQMRALGDEVRVRLIERTGHIELIAPESAAWAATVEEIERALGRTR
jgi:acetyl esterase/lipase